MNSKDQLRSALLATLALGGSSIVSLFMGLISAKASALLLGPKGVGFMALLQGLAGFAALASTLGIGPGLVRMGANALARKDDAEMAALQRAAGLLLGLLGAAAALVLVGFRRSLSQWVVGTVEHTGAVALMAVVVGFTLATCLPSSLLNAHHRVGALAKIGMLSSVVGGALSLLPLLLWRERGVAPALITGAFCGWAIAQAFARLELPAASAPPTHRQVRDAAARLVGFGVPYTASMIVGTGVQLVLPVLILHTLGAESVGFYRAAVGISVASLGFLLSAMSQDYYPRLSAAAGEAAELVQLVNQQHRLMMLLSAPIILTGLALAPFLVPLIYSSRFVPAVEVLEWQLVGNLFRFSSWTVAFVILARCSSSVFFLTESVAGATTLIASAVGIHFFGIEGAGIGFLVTYVVYSALVQNIARREIGLSWTLENKVLIAAAVGAAIAIRALPSVGFDRLRMPIALMLAAGAGATSLYFLLRGAGVIARTAEQRG